MPKGKTVKAIAKRFKKTGRGKVMKARAGGSHLQQTKNRKRKRRLGRFEELENPALAAKLRPHAK